MEEAKKLLEKALKKWHGNKILYYKHVILLLKLGVLKKNNDCFASALELVDLLKNPANKQEEEELEQVLTIILAEELYELEFVFEKLKEIGKNGNTEVQFLLGSMYEWGLGGRPE